MKVAIVTTRHGAQTIEFTKKKASVWLRSMDGQADHFELGEEVFRVLSNEPGCDPSFP